VLTAHPTEVQRKSILDAERDIAQLLAERDDIQARAQLYNSAKDALTPRELPPTRPRARVAQLWQTRLLRYTKLTVADEIENALSYYEATFLREIPKLYADLEALLGQYPVPAFLRMGQWIGGDRDGNPNVTPTRCNTRCAPGRVALRHYLTEVHLPGRRAVAVGALVRRVARDAGAGRALARHQRAPQDEPYRRALTGIYARLAATLKDLTGGRGARHAWHRRTLPQRRAFLADLRVIEPSLQSPPWRRRWRPSACTR
jgi:phosphoenolpyruvate carboxylase